MGFTIEGLLTTITIAGRQVTLYAKDLNLAATTDAVTQAMKKGLTYTASEPITATLEEISEWIVQFEEGLSLPPILSTDTTTGGALSGVSVIIQDLSVTLSSENPGFSFSLQVNLDGDFYDGLGIPDALKSWFSISDLGMSVAYSSAASSGA